MLAAFTFPAENYVDATARGKTFHSHKLPEALITTPQNPSFMPIFRLLDISHTKYLSDLILGLHKACLVLVRRFPSPSRSIPFGVVTLTLWPRGIRRPRD